MSCSAVATPCPPLQRGDIRSSRLAQAVPLSLPKGTGARGLGTKGLISVAEVFASPPVPAQRRAAFAEEQRLGRKVPPHPQKHRPFFFCSLSFCLQGAEQELVAQVCWCLWEKEFSLSGTRF